MADNITTIPADGNMASRQNLYKAVTDGGYNVGTFDQFSNSLNNPDAARQLYDAIESDPEVNYDLSAGYDAFASSMGVQQAQPQGATVPTAAEQPAAESDTAPQQATSADGGYTVSIGERQRTKNGAVATTELNEKELRDLNKPSTRPVGSGYVVDAKGKVSNPGVERHAAFVAKSGVKPLLKSEQYDKILGKRPSTPSETPNAELYFNSVADARDLTDEQLKEQHANLAVQYAAAPEAQKDTIAMRAMGIEGELAARGTGGHAQTKREWQLSEAMQDEGLKNAYDKWRSGEYTGSGMDDIANEFYAVLRSNNAKADADNAALDKGMQFGGVNAQIAKGYMQRANELTANDYDAVMQTAIGNLRADKEKSKRLDGYIMALSQKNGMTFEDAQNYVYSKVAERILGEQKARQMGELDKAGTFGFVVSGLGDSILGSIMEGTARTMAEAQGLTKAADKRLGNISDAENAAIQQYAGTKAGFMANLARGAMPMLLDMPMLISPVGKGASAIVGAGVKAAAGKAVKGVADAAAKDFYKGVFGRYVGLSLPGKIVLGATQGALTGAMFGATSTLAQQYRLGDYDMVDVFTSMPKEALAWGVMGAGGVITGNLAATAKSTVTRNAAKAAGVGIDGTVMAAPDMWEKYKEKGVLTAPDVASALGNGLATAVMFKVTPWAKEALERRRLAAKGLAPINMTFTETDHGNLSQYELLRNLSKGVETDAGIWAEPTPHTVAADGTAAEQAVKKTRLYDEYQRMMNDKEVPYETKAKVNYMMNGQAMAEPTVIAVNTRYNNDGTIDVYARTADGGRLQGVTAKTEAEAKKAVDGVVDVAVPNLVAVCETINNTKIQNDAVRRGIASYVADNGHIDVATAERIYSAISGKLNQGEPLTDAEKRFSVLLRPYISAEQRAQERFVGNTELAKQAARRAGIKEDEIPDIADKPYSRMTDKEKAFTDEYIRLQFERNGIGGKAEAQARTEGLAEGTQPQEAQPQPLLPDAENAAQGGTAVTEDVVGESLPEAEPAGSTAMSGAERNRVFDNLTGEDAEGGVPLNPGEAEQAIAAYEADPARWERELSEHPDADEWTSSAVAVASLVREMRSAGQSEAEPNHIIDGNKMVAANADAAVAESTATEAENVPTAAEAENTPTTEAENTPTTEAEPQAAPMLTAGTQPTEQAVAKTETAQPATTDNADTQAEQQPTAEPKAAQIAEAAKATDTEPTEAQKKAGNYRKGHVRVDGLDISIEQPKGSVRRGTDADGKQWESEMHDTYGYIRGTEGVDGDHIDVFLSDHPDEGGIYVVDQVDPKTGEFDEHKVMYGYASEEEAKAAYLSNYEKGWRGLGAITAVSREDFKKWIGSSHRKTKPFGEYSMVKNAEAAAEPTLLNVVKTLYEKGKTAASKLFNRSFFDVAKTPDFMKKLGLTGEKFTIRYGVISRHFGKDGSHDLTATEWEQLPDAIQKPFAITKLSDKKDGYRLYTTIKTAKGEYVVVGVDVKNAGKDIEVNAISTVFGRRENGNLPSNEEVLYKDKKITPEQSSLLEQPNSAQYPTEQELSAGKDTTPEAEKQEPSTEKIEARDTGGQTKEIQGHIVSIDEDGVIHVSLGDWTAAQRAAAEKTMFVTGSNGWGKDGIWSKSAKRLLLALDEADITDTSFVPDEIARAVKKLAQNGEAGLREWLVKSPYNYTPEEIDALMKLAGRKIERDQFFGRLAETQDSRKAEKRAADAEQGAGHTDAHGNPLNADGTLKLEKVQSVDEITDADFTAPTRSIELPTLPGNVDAAIGAGGKPVVIKKNILEKNKKSHKDLSPSQSREILEGALYHPNLYGQNQKTTRPYNWILVHNAEKHSSVILEVSHSKDNVEIVNWHYLDDATLKQKERQAIKEGGLILTLESAVGNTHDGLSSKGKGSEKISDEKEGVSAKAETGGKTDDFGEKKHKAVGSDAPTEADSTAPVGKDIFGDVYVSFKGKAKEAFDFLVSHGNGDLLGVFHREGVGDIDVVWGDKGGGLAHIIDKHIGKGKSFSDISEAAHAIDEIIKTGEVEFENGDRIVFKKGSKLVTIRKNVRDKGKKKADKNWVLTAYDELSADGGVSAIAPTNRGQAARTTDKSRNKGSNSGGKPQVNVEETSPSAPITDVGEKIKGARKDMLRDYAKSLDDVTVESLIALPFGKVFKRPKLKEAVEKGLLREKDARFAEAVMAAMLSRSKPRMLTGWKKAKSESDISDWAEQAYEGISILRELFNADEAGRDRLMEASVSAKAYDEEKVTQRKKQLEEWNPGKKFEGECYPINPLALFTAVYERLGYDDIGECKLPVSAVTPSSCFDCYELIGNNGKKVYPTRMLETFDDVVGEIVYRTKVENADEGTDHPSEVFKVRGNTPIKEVTGWGVLTLKRNGSPTPQTHNFKTKEEAEKFVQERKAAGEGAYTGKPFEKSKITGFKDYEIVFSLDDRTISTGMLFPSKEEAVAAIDAEHDKLNGFVNAKLAEGRGNKGGQRQKKDYVHIQYYTVDGKTWKYAVTLDERYAPKNTGKNTMPYSLADGFLSRKEAEAYIEEHRKEWDSKIAEINRQRKNFVFFGGEQERVGEDYRKGADVTAEQFREQFGFRGVQFGNWTNQKDRQAALNNAFDSFMDLSKLLGVSPRALSLNGELGIAFGARGTGNAKAHYELGEVVINLTKTLGAGSLAHEWWHALDNYFARRGNVKLGMVTENRGIAMREELRNAYAQLLSDLDASDYNKRSWSAGLSYWGSKREETARMFAMWVFDEMSKRGEFNGFLTDNNPMVEEDFARINYDFYTMMLGEDKKPMPFEEFRKTPAALSGYVFPTQAELEVFGIDLRRIFDTLQERVDEETGNVALLRKNGGGVVDPDREVRIVEAAAEHGFANYATAKRWARENIARTYGNDETGGKGEIRISNKAIEKYLSQSAVDKSESKDVHLSVLKVLPNVIREGVDAEQHPDYRKDENGVRSTENGINPNVTIHRLYGAVRIGDKMYRVKVTLKEDSTSKAPKVPHSYEATKIELFAGTLENSENSLFPNTNNSISAAKLLNGVEKSYRSGEKLIGEFAALPEGERRAAVEQEVAAVDAELGTRTVVKDTAELDDDMRRTVEREGGCAYYDPATGETVVLADKALDAADVRASVVHENIGHKRLDELLGDKAGDFYREAAEHIAAPEELDELRKDYPGADGARLGSEWMAHLSETEAWKKRPTLWRRFVSWLRMFMWRHFGTPLNRADADYMLWKAARHSAKSDRGPIYVAEDAVRNGERTDAQRVKFRTGRSVMNASKVNTAAVYERRMRNAAVQTNEAFVDSMASLREAMLSVYRAKHGGKSIHIEDIPSEMNPYTAENLLSSRNHAQQEEFENTKFAPMLDEAVRLAPNKDARQDLTEYMFAKHGLERNALMRQREFDALSKKLDDANMAGDLELAEKIDKQIGKLGDKDYAGLTGLSGTKNARDAEYWAHDLVDSYESTHDTSYFWDAWKDCTDEVLKCQYESGLISKESYETMRNMYDNYVPLRGFRDETASDVWAYLMQSHGLGDFTPIKRAEGRVTVADDPFATLAQMADTSIASANRNDMKKRLLNFVMKNPSDLFTVRNFWIAENPLGEWEVQTPTLSPDMTAEEIDRAWTEFEERMQQLHEQDPDKYKRGTDAVNIPYIITNREGREHNVILKTGGRSKIITINGNPRAAQAINGLTNPDAETNAALKAAASVNRYLSVAYTTANPDFVLSNLARDTGFSFAMTAVKESPSYLAKYGKNWFRAFPFLYGMLTHNADGGNGRLNGVNMQQMFNEFLRNGGETGYTKMNTIEQRKSEIGRTLSRKSRRGVATIKNAPMALKDFYITANRTMELASRFAAYLTSREVGRDETRAAYDAKEISGNFNKKGSGFKTLGLNGQTAIGNVAAAMSGTGRMLYVFFNPAVQGTFNNFFKYGFHRGKGNAAKMVGLLGAIFAWGFVQALLNSADDKDDGNGYYDLPDAVRRDNLIFKTGNGKWAKVPLCPEFRAVFGAGELAYSVMGRKQHMTDEELAYKMFGSATQILPIDPMESGSMSFAPFEPSTIRPMVDAYVANTNFAGIPIANTTDYNATDPEWKRVYKSADEHIVSISKWLNEISGGDDFTKGAVNFNPEKAEYLITNYTGGVGSTVLNVVKSGEMIFGDREFDANNVPILRRFYANSNERTRNRAVNADYAKYKEQMKETEARVDGYRAKARNNVLAYAGLLNELNGSADYEKAYTMKYYDNQIQKIRRKERMFDEETEADKIKPYEDMVAELKRQAVRDIQDIEDERRHGKPSVVSVKRLSDGRLSAIQKSIGDNLNDTYNQARGLYKKWETTQSEKDKAAAKDFIDKHMKEILLSREMRKALKAEEELPKDELRAAQEQVVTKLWRYQYARP